MKPVLSVVVPVYNEEPVLPEFYRRLKMSLTAMRVPAEILFVDDGSTDDSVSWIRRSLSSDPSVRLLQLSRNFGHQIALKAGIDHALGEAIVTIDADLQDPPEAISDMFAEWKKGHDFVFARRVERQGESYLKKMTASLYYRILKSLSSVKIPVDVGDYRLISREVADKIKPVRERNPYLRGWVAWAARSPKPVLIRREPRFAGRTKYSFFKMGELAFEGLRQFSYFNQGIRRAPQAGCADKPEQPVYTLQQ